MKSANINVNPPKGTKTDFVKASITIPPEIYDDVVQETLRRKIQKSGDPSISAVVREALQDYIGKKFGRNDC